MVETPDKNSLMVDGTPYKIAEICSHIASVTRSKKRVIYMADRNGGRFKADNRVVAAYDGSHIINTATNQAIDMSGRSDDMRVIVHIGSAPPKRRDESRGSINGDAFKYVQMGNSQMLAGDYQRAFDYYHEADKDDRHPVPGCGKAMALSLMNRHKEANKIIDKCLRHSSDMALVRATKVEVLVGQEKFKEIVKFATKCLEDKPYDVGMTEAKFHALFEMEEYEEIIEYADWCLARSDDAIKTIKRYSEIEAVGKHKLVRSMAGLMGIDESKDPDYRVRMANDYEGDTYMTMMYLRKISALNNLDRHEESLRIIEDLDGSEDVDPQVMLAEKSNILNIMGMYQKALDCHDCIKDKRITDLSRYKRGMILMKLSRHEEAIKEFERVPKTDSAYKLARGGIALSLAMLSKFEKAEKYANKMADEGLHGIWEVIAKFIARHGKNGNDGPRSDMMAILCASPDSDDMPSMSRNFLKKHVPDSLLKKSLGKDFEKIFDPD